MELSQEFLIDMAMNAGGYLLAGIISVILFLMFKKKKTATEKVFEETITDKNYDDEQVIPQATAKENVEYIAFGESQNENIVLKKKPIQQEVLLKQTTAKMNRKEAINIAKKMLLAGATQDKIKKVLPVSDSELALLSLNIR